MHWTRRDRLKAASAGDGYAEAPEHVNEKQRMDLPGDGLSIPSNPARPCEHASACRIVQA